MVGWGLRIPRTVQVAPDLAAMQFNTALAFFVCGLGLCAHLSGRQGMASGLAAAAGIVGLLTLSQYAFSIDLGLDQLIVRSAITIQTHPGRMAPMTASCFALCGAALFIAARTRWTPAVGVLGALVAALGGAAVVGYALDLPQTYRIGPWSSMALHTAAGFVALGTALLALAWPSWESKGATRWLVVFSGFGGAEEFDVILCDLMMPDLTGMDIYERILQIRPEIARQLVFMTGGAIGLRSEAFLDAVPNRRLHKPFRREDLAGIVRQALSRPERK
jgi:CheY-like chemotaxis protein